jgi:hypothetical protein
MLCAEQLFLVTRKLLWCVGTARQCCANQLVVVPSLQRGALLGRRASEDYDNLLSLYFRALFGKLF